MQQYLPTLLMQSCWHHLSAWHSLQSAGKRGEAKQEEPECPSLVP